MGFPTEFNTLAQIEAKFGSWRTLPLPISSGTAYVTDDTQMTLALGEGLQVALSGGPLTAERMEPPVREHFLAWYHSPENNRPRAAPACGPVRRWTGVASGRRPVRSVPRVAGRTCGSRRSA